MKKGILYIAILVAPIAIIVSVNEYCRTNNKHHLNDIAKTNRINSSKQDPNSCTWACHNNTLHCKTNHVVFAKPYIKTIDPFYFGIIDAFKATGKYGLANVLILALFIPTITLLLVIKIISMELKIRKLKST